MPKAEKRPCKAEGCTVLTASVWGYCYAHYATALQCEVRGCENRIAVYSKSKCCVDHRAEAVRFLRKRVRPWD